MPRAALQAVLCESADAEQAGLDGCFTEPQHPTLAQMFTASTACHSHQACNELVFGRRPTLIVLQAALSNCT